MIRERALEAFSNLLPAEERERVDAYFLADAGLGTDIFGLDPQGLRVGYGLAWWLHEHYFSVRSEGHHHVPERGAGVVVSNHSGVLPFDGMMIACDVFRRRQTPRLVRYMVDFFVYRMPFLGVFFRSIGQIPGTRGNFDGLVGEGHLVGIFPEGAAALAKKKEEHYQLRAFSHGHVELAARHRAPVIPVGVVGAEEQMEMVANLKPLARLLNLPYFPLTTTLVFPKPVQYRIRYGAPLEIDPAVLESIDVRRREVARVKDAVETLLRDELDARAAEEGKPT